VNVRLAAAALASIFVVLPLAAPAAPASPTITRQDGVTYIGQPDASAPLVNVTLVVRAGLNRQTLAQNGLSALTAETILRTPVNGTALEDAIAGAGGSIHFTVDPEDVRFSIESVPQSAPAVLALAHQALSAPSFAPATVRDARSSLVRTINQDQQIALQVGIEMLNRATSDSANTGLPALGIPASLAQLGPDDVHAFYGNFYRRGGSFVSSVGQLSALPTDAMTTLAQALPTDSSSAVVTAIPSLQGSSRQIVAHRDVSAPWLIAQYAAPSVDSKDFGPMLVLSAFLQRTLADIAQVPGVVSSSSTSRAVGALYSYDRGPASLTLYVDGGIGNPNRAFATALSVANILAATKLEGSIDEFKGMAAGDFATGSNTLETRAWLAVIFAEDGASPDYLARTLQAISTTTAADLQRVARTYLGNPTIALVLPRDNG
jgi:predicted Zn-dependent peptidase